MLLPTISDCTMSPTVEKAMCPLHISSNCVIIVSPIYIYNLSIQTNLFVNTYDMINMSTDKYKKGNEVIE